MGHELRGIFASMSTAFHDDLTVDYKGVESLAQFALDAGAKGVLTTAVSGEFYTLSDEEHCRVVETIAKRLDDQIPMVVGVVSDSAQQLFDFVRHACSVGASGINLTPPYMEMSKWGTVPPDKVFDFFAEVDKITEVPMFIQNSKVLGCEMSADMCVDLAKTFEHVQYIKEEGYNSRQNITTVLEKAKDLPEEVFKGVMTGSCHNILEDFERGVIGVMNTPQFIDIVVDIWDAWFGGDKDQAIFLHKLISPMVIYEDIYWESLAKYIQKKRGVIESDAIRSTISMFDDVNRREVDRMLAYFEPYLRVKY